MKSCVLPRQAVARTVRTLGFDPVSQDDFPTGYGELRQWLREQLDSCEGIIQLVGDGYGAEPPEVDHEYGRISYTQFEFLYAYKQKKKTWIIVIDKDFKRDKSSYQLDLPRDSTIPPEMAIRVSDENSSKIILRGSNSRIIFAMPQRTSPN